MYVMEDDITNLLNDINELQKINKQLGCLKQYADYLLLMKCYCAALVYIYVATKGWQRILQSKPNGFDLLLMLYIAYMFSQRQ